MDIDQGACQFVRAPEFGGDLFIFIFSWMEHCVKLCLCFIWLRLCEIEQCALWNLRAFQHESIVDGSLLACIGQVTTTCFGTVFREKQVI